MGVHSRRKKRPPAWAEKIFGCLEETGVGLAFRRVGVEGRRHIPLADDALADLVLQDWDRRHDPEPHVLAFLRYGANGEPVVVTVEYVEPHHNFD